METIYRSKSVETLAFSEGKFDPRWDAATQHLYVANKLVRRIIRPVYLAWARIDCEPKENLNTRRRDHEYLGKWGTDLFKQYSRGPQIPRCENWRRDLESVWLELLNENDMAMLACHIGQSKRLEQSAHKALMQLEFVRVESLQEWKVMERVLDKLVRALFEHWSPSCFGNEMVVIGEDGCSRLIEKSRLEQAALLASTSKGMQSSTWPALKVL